MTTKYSLILKAALINNPCKFLAIIFLAGDMSGMESKK